MYYSKFKHILSTLLYTVVLFFVLWVNNLLINWALRHVILPFFRWFYELTFIFKALIIVFGGSLCGIAIFGVFMWIAEIISRILAYTFIYNKATYFISILMVLANIVLSAIDMWGFIQWDFWAVIIWLLVFYFIFQMSWTFVFKDKRILDIQAGIDETYSYK